MTVVPLEKLSLVECAFLGSNILAARRARPVRRRRPRERRPPLSFQRASALAQLCFVNAFSSPLPS